MNTLQIALWTACLGTVAALLLAYAICYSRSLTARLAEIVAVLPVAVPHMVMALGFLWAVTGIEYWRENPGTLSVMIVAIMTAYIGIGVRTMLSTMVQIPQVLDEAARVSGASLLVRLVRIIGPVILPTVVSVWRIFFILAILEISIVVLLYRSESVTISVMTFLRVYETGTAAAFPLGVLQLGMVLAAVLLTSFLNFCLRRMQTPASLNAR
jgi:iron(III) transport system permease protein